MFPMTLCNVFHSQKFSKWRLGQAFACHQNEQQRMKNAFLQSTLLGPRSFPHMESESLGLNPVCLWCGLNKPLKFHLLIPLPLILNCLLPTVQMAQNLQQKKSKSQLTPPHSLCTPCSEAATPSADWHPLHVYIHTHFFDVTLSFIIFF